MRMVNIYRCKDCGLEVGLTPPVERPCPNCGGRFASISMFDENRERSLYTPIIDRVVADGFDTLMEEMESYLEEQALDA